jgi:DNA-binding NarL/FixJ family response regulator
MATRTAGASAIRVGLPPGEVVPRRPRPDHHGAGLSVVLDTESPTITVLAPTEVVGRRLESVLAAAHLTVLGVERTVPALIRHGAHSLVVIASGRSISERRTTLGRLRKRFPETRIVVVGPSDSRAAVRATIEAGADGLLYDADVERSLVPTVEAVLAGQVVVPADRRREMDPPTLSGREKQALGLVIMGLSNREIASQLFLAESTVKCHLSSAFAKLGVRSRHEAVTEILAPNSRLGIGILDISTGERPRLEARS